MQAGRAGVAAKPQEERKTLFQPGPAVLEAASVRNQDSPALRISVSRQQPAMLSLCEFCKMPLPYLNPPENAIVCWGFLSQSHSLACYSAFDI